MFKYIILAACALALMVIKSVEHIIRRPIALKERYSVGASVILGAMLSIELYEFLPCNDAASIAVKVFVIILATLPMIVVPLVQRVKAEFGSKDVYRFQCITKLGVIRLKEVFADFPAEFEYRTRTMTVDKGTDITPIVVYIKENSNFKTRNFILAELGFNKILIGETITLSVLCLLMDFLTGVV